MKNIFPTEIISLSVENHFSTFSKKSRLIYFMVLLFFVLVVVSLFIIQVEITVQSRGLLRSSGEPIQITAPVVAEVTKSVLVENRLVAKGDTLVWLNNRKLKERVDYLQSLNAENEAYLNDIEQMLGFHYTNLKTSLLKTTHAHYRQQLAEFDLSIQLLQKAHTRAFTLFEKKVIPMTEMEEKEFQLHYKLEEKKNFVHQTRNDWQQLTTQYKQAIKKNKNEIDGLIRDMENYFILAPGTGNIANYNGIRSGSFVTTGQTIATISLNEDIISEHLVPPKDIGYLRKEMHVIFQVDAYNYNQWGLATGSITDISKEIYLVNNRPFFKVRCRLNETQLTLKNGYIGKLKKGLTATARFKITKRTLAQLFFDKTDNWLNPNIIKD
jgi:multidrug resistance efflux pump